MLIINAEFPAGLTIEEAIKDALDFAKKNNCMVNVNLNDVPMVIFYSDLFGDTMEEKVRNFVRQYQSELEKKNHIAETEDDEEEDEQTVDDCPFCGSESVAESGDYSNSGVWWVQVRCTKCKARMKDSYNPKEDWKTREMRLAELVADWNRRV